MTRRMSTVKGAALPRSAGGSRARRWPLALAAGAGVGLAAPLAVPATASPGHAEHHSSGFRQVNLISGQPGVAATMDADLVNAWGMSASPGTDASPGSPLWVSDNEKDKTTLYNGAPPPALVSKALAVDVTSGAPTGQVFNQVAGTDL